MTPVMRGALFVGIQDLEGPPSPSALSYAVPVPEDDPHAMRPAVVDERDRPGSSGRPSISTLSTPRVRPSGFSTLIE